MGDVYDTGWAISSAFDRADPMATEPLARSIYTCIAKGLVGSKSKPFMAYEAGFIPRYIYFMLNIQHLVNNSLEEMKRLLMESHTEYDGLDKICAERWGTFDLAPWCEDNDIEFEAIHPGYEKQKEAFTMLFTLYRDLLFKTPRIPIQGQKMDDLLEEEAMVFDHDIKLRWFGSNEKFQKYGVQDDAMYSLGWNVYGSRTLGPDKLRERTTQPMFGQLVINTGHLGRYI